MNGAQKFEENVPNLVQLFDVEEEMSKILFLESVPFCIALAW